MLKNEGGKVKKPVSILEATAAYQLLADMVKSNNSLHATNEERSSKLICPLAGDGLLPKPSNDTNFDAKFKLWRLAFHSLKAKRSESAGRW